MFDTMKDEEKALGLLVSPWLPNATVTDLEIAEECGCYSEWTQDPCRYCVTFTAPWAGTDEELSRLVAILEPFVEAFSETHHTFQEARSCCEGCITRWVRVIPIRSKSC